MEKEEKEALRKLLKRSTTNTTVAWGLTGLSLALFFNGNIFGFEIPHNAFLVTLILALMFKLESIHLFHVWVYDTKRLSCNIHK